ncbi:alkaline shock response membrane anchor protein AmaP [Weissella koreensis]|uniref:Alkaline shock response membrane anchor protein AmaP n=1 Tax=Weissella koreensis TaxID=165096 RepID=A0A7H1MN85_9LACO|nr:alkaline shock response membrane anchor protein AmaP [Weissella koreensis]AEJ24107.1 hypothetical protein WKK_06185 [Weissella koreensis KACC 15510]AVH75719.1 alkaline shock response membrane anchor protein AmaP [Weissella koreensis]EJF34708.1 hypothetical protein JC2156_15490 [Weissella koreensis KCTC 3621]MCZ9311433.1 alkaline shock response membrane anchor protein AmaP [Weissella koreensis]QGN20940.1 alkaline shock response membrane anchor protein AmaP [Weissella koreensis]
MKKWKKILMAIVTILYIFPFISMIKPHESKMIGNQINAWLIQNNINNFTVETIIEIYLIICVVFLIIMLFTIIFWPSAKNNVVLTNQKSGKLALDNRGISSFINQRFKDENLENINIKIKNQVHSIKIKVSAESKYQQDKVQKIIRLQDQINKDLNELLKNTDINKINTNIVINRPKNSKNIRVL